MADFIKAAGKSSVLPGASLAVEVGGKRVALFNVEGQIYALGNNCPHRGGPLAEGDLAGKEITCPWHGWTFDVSNGCGTHTPAQAQSYPVKVEGDDIFVAVG